MQIPPQGVHGIKSSNGHGRGMIERIVYIPDAGEDVADSYDWYESREPGLGEDFLRSIEACLAIIQRHPYLFPVALDEFRHAPIRRFPFEVFYEPDDEEIVVYAVFHCSQDPNKWRKRLLTD